MRRLYVVGVGLITLLVCTGAAAAVRLTSSAPKNHSTVAVAHQQFIDPPWVYAAFMAALKQHLLAPTKTPPPRSAALSRPTTYTVVAGDSFSSIAKHLNVSIFNLAADNHMQLYSLLLPGEVLKVPPLGEKPAAPMPWSAPAPLAPYVARSTSSSSQATTPVRTSTRVAAAAYVPAGASGWPNSCYGITNADALYIIHVESNCNVYARNPSSGACGIGQLINGCDTYDGYRQAAEMTSYVMGRYGSWSAAAAHERAYNWY